MLILQTLTMKHLESPRKCKLEKEKKEQGRAWLNTLKEKRNIEINFMCVGQSRAKANIFKVLPVNTCKECLVNVFIFGDICFCVYIYSFCICISCVSIYIFRICLCSCTNDKRKEDENGRMPVDEGKNGRQGCNPEYCSQSEHLCQSQVQMFKS